MACSVRQASRFFLNMRRPIADTSVLRTFSVSAGKSAEKPPTKAPKSAAPPKPATPTPPSTKGDTYQAQELFAYDEMSYYELESDMRKSRLPQPKPGQPCD